MVDMQVRKEDVLNQLSSLSHGDDVSHAARTQIKEEIVAIAQLHHNARTGLVAARWPGSAANKRDTHLIRPELLAVWEVIRSASHRGGWS